MAGGGVLAGVDLNVLSLLPRTLGPRYDAAVPSGKWSEEKELDAIRCFFKSMISRDQGKLTGEDEDKVTDPLNAFDDDGNETETVNHMDRRQGRRPGLGRKRARFSFNPNLSDPLLRLDTKSRLNHIKDPEEYFAAVAKMELAEKVLKKLRGEADTECTQESQWTAPRKHRPGLPWNRVRKRHQFIPPFESAEATSLPRCEDLPLSPMKSTKDSSFNPSFPATNQSGKLQQGKTANTDLYTASDFQGSTVEGEKSVDHVLSDLLYCFEDVNEGEEIEFLEKKLRIKSISVDKICLPPLDRCSGNNLAIMDGKRTGESLDSSKNVSEKKSHSPLALLASLKRRITQKDHQEDPFSMESLSDSSSEDFSLNEGSCRPSKTRSRLHSRGKSHASSFESQAGMRIPISMALEDGGVDSRCMGQHPCMPIVANDVALASIKPNSRDKVDDILMEASVAEELITDVVDISERTVGDGVSCGTSSDNKVHDVYEAPASIGVKDIFSSSLNNDAERTLHTSSITSQGDVIPHPLRASSEEKANDALADESVHEDKIANDNTTLDNAIKRDSSDVNCMDNYEVSVPQQEPKSFGAGTEVIVGAESTESVREDQPTSNTVVDFGFEEESDDMHQEAQITGEEDSDDEELPLGFANSELKRTSDFDDASKNKANEVEEAHARSNEDQSNAEADSGDKELELDFMNSAPERASSSFDASTNKANDVQEAHAPSKEDRSNADVDANIPVGRCSEISGIIDEHNVEVSDPREGPVSFDAGTEVIANAESSESVREEQPKSTSVIDFGFEKESDDIHQEALITSEGHSDDEILPSGFENSDPAGASSFDTSMNKNNEVDEVHAPSNEDQSNADADCGEKELDLGVVNSELERASSAFDASMNEANDLHAHAPSNEDQSSADVDANIPVGGCSGNSGILIEHNVEGENQPSSTALLNPKEAPRKRRGNQRKTDRRQSLAAAGTAWQCGVRRSTRIRTKPLAHWRGERLLYARIHDTLPTVIGMKYASPGKNTLERPPVLKVKSFVSEEYADLLQKVSLH